MDEDLTDDQLLAAFEGGKLDNDEFPHARHVRVAWLLARTYGNQEGLRRLIAGLRAIAARAGHGGAYHETITRGWFELIASVDDLSEREELLDKTLLTRYYSPARLAAGRDRWLAPDLHPLGLPPPDVPGSGLDWALTRIPTAVAVLAARVEETVHAATVSWVTPVSREPALVSVSLANGSRTLDLVRRGDAFTLSILASDGQALAARFADRARPLGAAQFAGVSHHMTEYGPVLDDAVVTLGCRLHALHVCGDHELVIGAIRTSDARPERRPLVRLPHD
jgi:flavin reductase (DIM6/NTAB) family NADH-FMN oxidoreductase RutF